MNTIEAIKTRRSIRRFKSDQLSHEILENIIEAASFSPSWKNTQITRYNIIETEELKNKIASNHVPEYNKQAINTAPILIALTVRKYRSGYERDGSYSTSKGDGWEMYDCGIASQTLCLAAHELGLGTVIMGIFDHEVISELLNISSEYNLISLIAIGYPDIEPETPKRKNVNELIQYL